MPPSFFGGCLAFAAAGFAFVSTAFFAVAAAFDGALAGAAAAAFGFVEAGLATAGADGGAGEALAAGFFSSDCDDRLADERRRAIFSAAFS